jgi:hypothetical protein
LALFERRNGSLKVGEDCADTSLVSIGRVKSLEPIQSVLEEGRKPRKDPPELRERFGRDVLRLASHERDDLRLLSLADLVAATNEVAPCIRRAAGTSTECEGESGKEQGCTRTKPANSMSGAVLARVQDALGLHDLAPYYTAAMPNGLPGWCRTAYGDSLAEGSRDPAA